MNVDRVWLPLTTQSNKSSLSPSVHNHYCSRWAVDGAAGQMRRTAFNGLQHFTSLFSAARCSAIIAPQGENRRFSSGAETVDLFGLVPWSCCQSRISAEIFPQNNEHRVGFLVTMATSFPQKQRRPLIHFHDSHCKMCGIFFSVFMNIKQLRSGPPDWRVSFYLTKIILVCFPVLCSFLLPTEENRHGNQWLIRF